MKSKRAKEQVTEVPRKFVSDPREDILLNSAGMRPVWEQLEKELSPNQAEYFKHKLLDLNPKFERLAAHGYSAKELKKYIENVSAAALKLNILLNDSYSWFLLKLRFPGFGPADHNQLSNLLSELSRCGPDTLHIFDELKLNHTVKKLTSNSKKTLIDSRRHFLVTQLLFLLTELGIRKKQVSLILAISNALCPDGIDRQYIKKTVGNSRKTWQGTNRNSI